MAQPPADQALDADAVIEELGNVHGTTAVRLADELARTRVRLRQVLAENAELRAQLDPGAGS